MRFLWLLNLDPPDSCQSAPWADSWPPKYSSLLPQLQFELELLDLVPEPRQEPGPGIPAQFGEMGT